jgi:tRNA pseudouridine55 synthase
MARRRPPTVHGLVVVDKPTGVTSHDVVGVLRRRFDERRIGHAGTLDPDATGVLLVGVGRVTRLLRFLTALGKRYHAEVVFGTTTATLDAAGEVTGSFAMDDLTAAAVRAVAAEHLTGAIMQVPPMVSALKVGGRRLHELAREGIEVERAARPVTIHALALEPTADPLVYTMDVRCSSGTYVRSLAADLGTLLGGGAHLRALRRTAVGSFTDDQAAPPLDAPLHPPTFAVRDYPSLIVDEAGAARVAHGRTLEDVGTVGDGACAVIGPDGELLAMYEVDGAGVAKPAVVLSTE